MDILKNFAVILGVSALLQAISYLFSRVFFRAMPHEKRGVFQYCIIAVYIGLFLMIFQNPLDLMLAGIVENTGAAGSVLHTLVQALNKAIRSIGGCTTAATMLLIGSMMADVRPREMLDMDAARMTAILAAKHGRDYVLGTKCVVLSTLIFMLTVPL